MTSLVVNWANVRRLHDAHDRFQHVLAVQPTTTRMSYKPCSFRLCIPGTNHNDQSFTKVSAFAVHTNCFSERLLWRPCWKVCAFDAHSCGRNVKRKMFAFSPNTEQKCRVHTIVFRSFKLPNRSFTLRMPRTNRNDRLRFRRHTNCFAERFHSVDRY